MGTGAGRAGASAGSRFFDTYMTETNTALAVRKRRCALKETRGTVEGNPDKREVREPAKAVLGLSWNDRI